MEILRRKALIPLALVILPAPVAAAEALPTELYYLAIGSQHYVALPPSAPVHWETVAAPVNSAERVANLLQEAGAKFGIVLTSNASHAVTTNDVKQALVDLKTRIRRDRSKSPLIVFYYMGHALGDTYTETLYLAPGDLDLKAAPSQSTVGVLARSSLSNLDIISSLEGFRLPESMAFEDGFFPSNLYFDPASPDDMARASREAIDLTTKDEFNVSVSRTTPSQDVFDRHAVRSA